MGQGDALRKGIKARSGLPYSRAGSFLTLILAPASRARMGARQRVLASAFAWP